MDLNKGPSMAILGWTQHQLYVLWLIQIFCLSSKSQWGTYKLCGYWTHGQILILRETALPLLAGYDSIFMNIGIPMKFYI